MSKHTLHSEIEQAVQYYSNNATVSVCPKFILNDLIRKVKTRMSDISE